MVVANENEDASEALQRMRVHGVRRLPVVGLEGRLVGILTLDDVLDLVAADLNAKQWAILLRDNDQVAVVQSGWKLLWAPVEQLLELYRLGNEDPDAELSGQYPEIARELRRLILYSPLRGLPPLVVLGDHQ